MIAKIDSLSKASKNNNQYNESTSSLEAEQAVLGSLLLNHQYWEELEQHNIQIFDFYYPHHKSLYRFLLDLRNQNKPYDFITVSEGLKNRNKLAEIGGMNYIQDLLEITPSEAQINLYAEILKHLTKLRSLLNASQEIIEAIQKPSGRSADEILDLAESKIMKIAEVAKKGLVLGPSVIKDVTYNILYDFQDRPAKRVLVSSGFKELDELIVGLMPGNLLIIAGRPSMGKTTFAINIVEKVATKTEKPILIFSLEMSAEDIVLKMISSIGAIEQSLLRAGKIEHHQWSKILPAVELVSHMNIYIDDKSTLTPQDVRSIARKLHKEHGQLGLIVIDYLQLMTAPGYDKNRVQEVSEISRSLKSLARELNVPIIALSQLNRNVDERFDKRPMLSDLRESGALEQDADLIMFIYREEVYNHNALHKGLAEVIVGKQRNGPTGKIEVLFEGKYSRFRGFEENNIIINDQ